MEYTYFQISKKCRYALQALYELAIRSSAGPVNGRSLANAQQIPARFLEIILNELKQGGFVNSHRGKAGGYVLSKPAAAITLAEVVRFLEKNVEAQPTDGPVESSTSVTDHVLREINTLIGDICVRTTLQDLVDEELKRKKDFTPSFEI